MALQNAPFSPAEYDRRIALTRAAMARALEAIAFSDLPDLVSGPNAKRVNQKAKRKAQRALLALAETAFEEEPLF